MNISPTGRFLHRPDGLYLLFDRVFHALIDEVWYSVANPKGLETWLGTYTGDPQTRGVRFLMSTAENAQWQYTSILECVPPRRLLVDIGEDNPQRVFCHLNEAAGGRTTLVLGQRVASPEEAEHMGPSWEYHLDRLVASRTGNPPPSWESYWPGLGDHYSNLLVPEH